MPWRGAMPFIVIPDGNVASPELAALLGLLPPVAGGGRGLPTPGGDAGGLVLAGGSGEPDAAEGAGGTVPGPVARNPASVVRAAEHVAGRECDDGVGRAPAPFQQPRPSQHGDPALPDRSPPSVASSRTRNMLGGASATLRRWTAGLSATGPPAPGATRASTPSTCLKLTRESAVPLSDGDGMLDAVAAAAAEEIMAAPRTGHPPGGRSTAADPDASEGSSAEEALREGGADGEDHPARRPRKRIRLTQGEDHPSRKRRDNDPEYVMSASACSFCWSCWCGHFPSTSSRLCLGSFACCCDMLFPAKSLYTDRLCGTAFLSIAFCLHFFSVLDFNTGNKSFPCTGQVAKLRMWLVLRLLNRRRAARLTLPVGASASVRKWRRQQLRRAPPSSYGESVDVTFPSHPLRWTVKAHMPPSAPRSRHTTATCPQSLLNRQLMPSLALLARRALLLRGGRSGRRRSVDQLHPFNPPVTMRKRRCQCPASTLKRL